MSTGDFNGDGQTDLVAQNSQTNQVWFYYLKGAKQIGGAYLSPPPNGGWRLVGFH